MLQQKNTRRRPDGHNGILRLHCLHYAVCTERRRRRLRSCLSAEHRWSQKCGRWRIIVVVAAVWQAAAQSSLVSCALATPRTRVQLIRRRELWITYWSMVMHFLPKRSSSVYRFCYFSAFETPWGDYLEPWPHGRVTGRGGRFTYLPYDPCWKFRYFSYQLPTKNMCKFWWVFFEKM